MTSTETDNITGANWPGQKLFRNNSYFHFHCGWYAGGYSHGLKGFTDFLFLDVGLGEFVGLPEFAAEKIFPRFPNIKRLPNTEITIFRVCASTSM